MAREGSEGVRLGERVPQQPPGPEGAPGLVWKCPQHLPGVNLGQKCYQLLSPGCRSLWLISGGSLAARVVLNGQVTKTRPVANQAAQTNGTKTPVETSEVIANVNERQDFTKVFCTKVNLLFKREGNHPALLGP